MAWTINTGTASSHLASTKSAWIALLKKLGFSSNVALALYEDQLLIDNVSLMELDDNKVEQICCAMHKPGGSVDGHQIAELAVTCLQLALFYPKHLEHCGYQGPLEDADANKINSLKEQHEFKKDWKSNNSDPDLKAMMLDQTKAPIAFKQVKTILHGMWGSTGIFLTCHLPSACPSTK